MAASDELLSQAQLARRWRKSPEKIRRWTALGLLPTFTDPDSGRVYYPARAADSWLEHFRPERSAS